MKNEKLLIFISLFSFLYANINDKIIEFYKSYYPNIKIENIKISPTPPKTFKNLKILLSPKRSYGNIKIDNRFYYVRIKALIKVYKAKQIIKTNELIYNKVKEEFIPFRTFYSKPLDKIDTNLVASKIISKNGIINESNTKKKPLIFKGDTISAIINSKNISITSKAKALEDGYKGDEIKILINKKIKKGTVLNKGVVKVE